MKTNKFRRCLSTVLAIFMLLTILPSTVLADGADANSVSIWFSTIDNAAKDFPVIRRQLTVPAGTGAKYGWNNAEPGHLVGGQDHGVEKGEVTVMDALLYGHEEIYGDAFTKDTMGNYISGSAAYVTKIFECSGSGIGFAVNDRLPVGQKSDGYAANEYVLQDGDEVTWFLYGGDYWEDYYSYFDKKSADIETGEPLTLTLESFMAMGALSGSPGTDTPALEVRPVEGATIMLADEDGTLLDVLGDMDTPVETDENGQFTYTFGKPGTYYLTANGTVAAMGLECPIVLPWCEVTVTEHVVDVDPNVSATWPNFRGSENNMAIVDAFTPKDAAHTELKWAKKFGSGWMGPSPAAPIIVDDSLIVMCGNELMKLNLDDGEILATAQMSSKPNWGYTPPAYAEGLIFCPLSGGVIEAFSAKTLEKVWSFDSENSNNDQALSPITYADGRIYTGYWKGEPSPADFLCLNAQTGELEWSYEVNGGFYWAGSVVIGDYVVVGTDDGETGSSKLLVFNKTYAAGEDIQPVSSVELTGCGDQRSSLAYADGKVYFTTKGGFLGSAAINAETGAISELKTVSLANEDGYREATSTPIVYGDYVYFGVGKSFSNGWFVIAERDTLEVVKTLELIGYPQCSMLLSTTYLEEDGKLRFYSTYNGRPGGLSLITVEPDAPETAALSELYNAEGYEQYCICSPICDADGTIYYKNDSGNILAVGRKVVPEVTVAAYDYNAGAASIEGASESGVVFKETISFIDGLTAVDAANTAAEQAGVELIMSDGYVSAIGGLGAGEGMSGWCLNYNNDDFANLGLQSLTLASGDQISFHYSVNPDGQTDDIGNGWYGKPIITSLTLAGRTVTMRKETTFDTSGNSATKYFLRGSQGGEKEMTGSGTETDPFIIPISLPAGTDLKSLEAIYETSLGEHYRKVTGLDGGQDYSDDHSVTLATLGGNTVYYIVKADVESNGGGSTDNPISVSFRLIGATKSTEDVNLETGTGDSEYQNWIKTKSYKLDKNATVYDLFTKALDDAGLSYKGAEENYVKSITAPSVYGGYQLSEFTNGPRSGWMYTLNGKHPNLGLCEQKLKDGDKVIWHYVNDYAYEVKDWFDDPAYPGQGNEDTWVDWEKDIEDSNPSSENDDDNRPGRPNTGRPSGSGGSNISVVTPTTDPTMPSDNETPFTDIVDHWAKDMISYAYENGLMTGMSDTAFNPDGVLSRAMLVTVLYRMADEPETAAETAFSDVMADTWYTKAVSWASENEIVSGYGDGNFGPEDAITREQLTAIFYRYAGSPEISGMGLDEFADANAISDYAKSAMLWAVQNGIVNGKGDGIIDPAGNATRAETATIFYRYLEKTES